MAIANFTDLKNAVIAHLERDDLGPHIDNLVLLGSSQVSQDIRVQDMLKRLTVTVDDRFIDLPANFLEMISFRLITSPIRIISPISIQEMARRRRAENGIPRFYAIHEQIELDIVPDQSFSGEFIFYEQLAPLSDANPTNTLLVRVPGLYLYASLAASAPFLMNDERLQTWATLYLNLVTTVNRIARTKTHGAPLVSRVVGGIA